MSPSNVLVTGGAGFIGSHLVDRLLEAGHRVRVLDALLPQVHPDGPPAYLSREAELQVGDVRDREAVKKALDGVEMVVHFASAVGVGQSMYEIEHYCSVNVMGTATLLEAISQARQRPRQILVASSMSLYGEGLYTCEACGPVQPDPRPAKQLERRDWETRCPRCDRPLAAAPTPETKAPTPTSVYAINKRDQEEMVLAVGRSLGIAAVALRFFNTYGSRQALSNPYTGVAAIFSSALLNGRAPLIFEDGMQVRDFIHVSDIVTACVLALQRGDAATGVFNVGTGQATSLLTLTSLLRTRIAGAERVEPQIVGRFREGDIRACYADIGRARDVLGFEPKVRLEEGVRLLADWVKQQVSHDESTRALDELERRRLVR
jgi:dTDP-L-rhamnose 4-epimerase